MFQVVRSGIRLYFPSRFFLRSKSQYFSRVSPATPAFDFISARSSGFATNWIGAAEFCTIDGWCATAFAEQPRGVYIGVGVGDAKAEVSPGDMDQLFRNAFRLQGGTFSPQTSAVETEDSHLYVFGGYRIFPWLSAEAGYIDLGSFEYTSR
ncbi:MAG TPA: hypothetical protein VK629_00010, partial [Steroidobacteraceae bacterium]|nr:hypothetical protein [Steroidobacteraceae bacterium]